MTSEYRRVKAIHAEAANALRITCPAGLYVIVHMELLVNISLLNKPLNIEFDFFINIL